LLSSCLEAAVLLVSDGAERRQIEYYAQGLQRAEVAFETFDTLGNKRLPSLELLAEKRIVFWICGDSFHTLSDAEKRLLDDFLALPDNVPKALFLEGERLMSDAAFIDHGYFFRGNFGVDYNQADQARTFMVETSWLHPVSWGVPERFRVEAVNAFDIMRAEEKGGHEILFRVTGTDQEIKGAAQAIGVSVDSYHKRLILLSFSPPVRQLWELETSQFLSNLIRWLHEDFSGVLSRVTSVDKADAEIDGSSAENMLRFLVRSIDAGSCAELDELIGRKLQLPDETFRWLSGKIMETYRNSPEWHKNLSLRARLELLE
ncbi:MAG: hypothetical protein PHQ23_13555, partial [Candidatus Wallbacteria bacterium]|nr:hypothetical protein [Candidatus Wallbacteria bacterium]